jgi:hypothetical protein
MSTTTKETQTQLQPFSRLNLAAEPIGNVKDLVLQDGQYLGKQVRRSQG